MELKSYLQDKITRQDPLEKEDERYGSYLHPKPFHADGSAINRSSFLNGEYHSHSSVSHGPPPSFLTKAPLGTTPEEVIEFMPKRELIVKRQEHEGMLPTTPSNRHAFEQAKQAPKRLKQKRKWLKMPDNTRRKVSKNGIVHRWIYEEVGLSMSKMSIMSMVLGLLFLGILFFIIGFLAAVVTLKSQEGGKAHSSQSAWQASNKPAHGDHGGGGSLGTIAGHLGGSIAGQAISKELQPLNKIVGKTASIVPAPLQPFARYGMNAARRQVQDVNRQVNPFAPHRRPVAAQQPYGGAQQQYPMTQPQGYQQQMPFPQGGNPAFAMPQQQMMLPQQQMSPQQQFSYQQPVAPQQQMMPQQMMGPQQQMMMQQPQYQQQMMTQQGYYR